MERRFRNWLDRHWQSWTRWMSGSPVFTVAFFLILMAEAMMMFGLLSGALIGFPAA